MAIKGKSRARHRSRGAMRAPAPKPQVRPKAILESRTLRRALVVLLSLGTLLGGLRVWENSSRAHTFRAYLTRLEVAQRPLVKHLDPSSETLISKTARAFGAANVRVSPFLARCKLWEADFRKAKEAVEKLTPPREIADAQKQIVLAIDMYIGVARLYNLAAQDREVADAQEDAAQAAFENQVAVTLQHAGEAEERANAAYSLGGAVIESYKRSWLGIPESTPVPGVPRGLIPTLQPTNPATPGG